jgi:hypothetical protein
MIVLMNVGEAPELHTPPPEEYALFPVMVVLMKVGVEGY